MNAETLMSILAATELPVVYHHWKAGTAPKAPYLVYLQTRTSGVFADGSNYVAKTTWQVELYQEFKDPTTEKQVEEVLKQASLPWEKTEVFIDSEELFQTVYDIETLGD